MNPRETALDWLETTSIPTIENYEYEDIKEALNIALKEQAKELISNISDEMMNFVDGYYFKSTDELVGHLNKKFKVE